MSVRSGEPVRALASACLLLSMILALPACSIKTMAVKTVANTLSDTGDEGVVPFLESWQGFPTSLGSAVGLANF